MATGLPVVNPDGIRKALGVFPWNPETESTVWYLAHMMVKALFATGHPVVILDATNLTERRRREWESKNYDLWFKVFPADALTCAARCDETNQTLKPVILRMAREYVAPEPSSCIDSVMEIHP
jgi:hypothetical protein